MRLKIVYALLFAYSIIPAGLELSAQENLYYGENGIIEFESDAPLELISASSNELKGAIDVLTREFYFTLPNESFMGFNGEVQQEHFHENYIESSIYKNSTFRGKIIEEVDIRENTSIDVRAKGILDIHGVKQERIINSTLSISENEILLHSTFTILLEDHNIEIPRIVYQKIAEVIMVNVEILLIKKDMP